MDNYVRFKISRATMTNSLHEEKLTKHEWFRIRIFHVIKTQKFYYGFWKFWEDFSPQEQTRTSKA